MNILQSEFYESTDFIMILYEINIMTRLLELFISLEKLSGY